MHERDTQTDLLLLLLRELLPKRPELRVVCMSATVQSELFSRYFEDCPVLTASGRSSSTSSWTFAGSFSSRSFSLVKNMFSM